MAETKNEMRGRAVGFGLVLLGVVTGAGLARLSWNPWDRGEDDGPAQRPPHATPALLARGEEIFAKQCATCHGSEGKGDGKAAYLLYPRPRDFSAGRFRLVSTENGQPTDRDLFATITNGMPGSAMPPWSHLSDEDRWALVFQVRRLTREGKIARLVEKGQSRAKAEEIADEILAPGRVVSAGEEPPVTADALARGRELYMTNCAACHDADGRGRKKRDLVDSSGHPILARDFTAGVFKGGYSSEAIATRLLAGMPDTPMPSYRKNLGEGADLWAVVHYVRSLVQQDSALRIQQSQRTIPAARVDGGLDADPANPIWEKTAPVYLALTPIWWRDQRVEGVNVRALHDGEKLALHLSWEDSAAEDHMLGQTQFPDAAAIQFSPSLDPPFFAMGQGGDPVQIWLWKACWQRDLVSFGDVEDVHPDMAVDIYPSLEEPPYGRHSTPGQFRIEDHKRDWLTGAGAGNPVSTLERKTAVESLSAQGFGTLTSHPARFQNVEGRGEFKDGTWRLVLVRDLAGAGGADLPFAPGTAVSAGFAVWDGKGGDRNGQKSVTIWHRLELEK